MDKETLLQFKDMKSIKTEKRMGKEIKLHKKSITVIM